MDLHLKYLSNICRCCGFEQSKDAELTSKLSPKVDKLCSIYEYLNFNEENNKIYPLYICSKCILTFEVQYNDYYSGKSREIKVHIAKYEEHKKENCSVCSYRVLDENSDPLYFDRKHMQILTKFCRMCKTLSVQKKSQENHKCSASFNKVFDSLVKDLLNNENIYLYPQYFCEKCCKMISKSQEKNLQKLEFTFATFRNHNHNCNICEQLSTFVNVKTESLITNATSEGALLHQYEGIFQNQVRCTQSHTSVNLSSIDIEKYTTHALKVHKENLTNFCRLCALPQSVSSKKKMVSKCSARFVECFAIFFRVNIIAEDPDIYPPNICLQCCYKLQVNFKARIKKKKAPFKLTSPFFFENYQHQCKICLYKKYFDTSKLQEEVSAEGNSCSVLKRKQDYNEITDEKLPLKRIKSCSSLLNGRNFGLPIEQLSSESKIEGIKYSCKNCTLIPEKLVTTKCQHLYCENCSKLFIAVNNTCYDETCRNLLDDCSSAGLYVQNKIAKLYFLCKHWDDCKFKGKLKDTLNHEATCQKDENLSESFCKLSDVNDNRPSPYLVKSEQLTRLKLAITKFCNENNKDLKASLSYLLWEQFNEEGNIQAAEYIMLLRKTENVKWDIFSTEESLALRYMFLKTHKQYEQEYMYFKGNYEIEMFKPTKEVEEIAIMYLPNAVSFKILDLFGNILHQKDGSSELSINSLEGCSSEKLITPFVGVYWNFIEAVSKAIYELSYSFTTDIEKADNHIAFVEIKDGMNITCDTSLVDQSKTIRIVQASFCILSIYCFVKGMKKDLFECDLPNLYKNNRIFFMASYDDIDSVNIDETIISACARIERFKSLVKHRLINVMLSNGKFSLFYFKIFFSMYDDKLDNLRCGISTTSLCRHCDLGTDEWLESIKDKAAYQSQFTYLETSEAVLNIPETIEQLKSNFKSSSLKQSHIYLNALYCDFTLAQTVKEIIVRETANIFKNISECSIEEREKYDDMVKVVDEYYHNYFGLNLQEIEKMSVNSINKFIDTASTDKSLELIVNTVEQRQKIQKLLHLLSKVRVVYNNVKPIKQYSADIVYFKRNAVKFSKFLLDNFKYCNSTRLVNCLHKICEHGQNCLLVEPYSIGILSSEGLQNSDLLLKKIWRSKKSADINQTYLAQVLKDCWLHTSPRLHAIGSAVMNNYRCTLCGLNGHSTCICPIGLNAKSKEIV